MNPLTSARIIALVCILAGLPVLAIGETTAADSGDGQAALRQISIMAKVLETRLQEALGQDLVDDNVFQAGGVRGFRIPHLVPAGKDRWLGVVFLANVTFPLIEGNAPPAKQPEVRQDTLWDRIERGTREPWGAIEVTDNDRRRIDTLRRVVLETLEKNGPRLTAIDPDDDIMVLVGSGRRASVAGGKTGSLRLIVSGEDYTIAKSADGGVAQDPSALTPRTWWALRAKKRDLLAGPETLRERVEIRMPQGGSTQDAEVAREITALSRLLERELDETLRGEVCTASMIHRGIEGFSVPSVGTFYSIEVRFPVAGPWWALFTPSGQRERSGLREAEENKRKVERLTETIFEVLADYGRLAARRRVTESVHPSRSRNQRQVSSQSVRRPRTERGTSPESLAEYLEFRLGSPAERREAEPCKENLRKISIALTHYRQDHNGNLPPALEDLYPRYLQDESILVCPRGHRSSFVSLSKLKFLNNKKVECSYYYEFSRRGGGDAFKMRQAREYGDKVPVVSCLGHPRGRVALSYGGEIYISEHFWENVYPKGHTLDDNDARVRKALLQIAAALAKYRKDHDEPPRELKDLCPDYVENASLFVCPVTSQPLVYEFAPAKRERNLQLLNELGGYVPIVRAPGVLENGRVINLAYSGEIYESGEEWESFVRQIVTDQPRPEDRIVIVVDGKAGGDWSQSAKATKDVLEVVLTGLEKQLDALNEELRALQREAAPDGPKSEALEKRLRALEKQLGALQSGLRKLDTQLGGVFDGSENASGTSEVETKSSTPRQQLNRLESEVSTLRTRLEASQPPVSEPFALRHGTALVIVVDMSIGGDWDGHEDVARLATVEAYAY